MKPMQTLREFLAPYAHDHLRDEPLCTCGDANHVRLLLFRLDGYPVTVVLPESASPTLDEVREALGGLSLTRLTEEELETIHAESELGRSEPFSNPFGTTVYLDESLILYPTLVFCPRMFGGTHGECFRVPTRSFIEATQATVRPLLRAPCTADDWAV